MRARPATIVLALFVGLVVAAGLTAGTLLLLTRMSEKPLPAAAPGVPVEISEDALRDLARSSGHSLYWAGSKPGSRLELTRNQRGEVFIRYLGEEARLGDPRANFTTIGTYPRPGAYQLARRTAGRPGMLSRAAPAGGIAVWQSRRPTSVYLAYPRSGVLVEVYDPDAAEARRLAVSGDVTSIR